MPEYRWCRPPRLSADPSTAVSRSAGISSTKLSSTLSPTALVPHAAGPRASPRIAHQPDKDLGARFVGNHVGRAPAVNRPDIQRARAKNRIDRQLDFADGVERVKQFLDRRIAQLRVSRMRHLTVRHQLIAQRAFRSQGQLILRRLAVDDVLRPARIRGGMISARAVALFAHHKQQREIARRRLRAASPPP